MSRKMNMAAGYGYRPAAAQEDPAPGSGAVTNPWVLLLVGLLVVVALAVAVFLGAQEWQAEPVDRDQLQHDLEQLVDAG